ncbi:MAG: CinA family nicotinamide mononucleotide deamidase-related protein [Deltaproteobacteria bacterium]|nr:MAG: CinA family nicotinamide mononucleotide deamidase-related protein [Deltaproteobacteria bacterium]
MTLAVLAIGDELLNGDQPDTNTADIARLLAGHGLALGEAACVRDREEEIAAALNRLAAAHRAVIVTGGLGPTADDRTARAAAKALGVPLALDPVALKQIRDRFQAWGRPMHPRDEKQALLPARAAVLANPEGVAPGFHLRHPKGAELFFLPGVPAEMRAMLAAGVLPRLLAAAAPRPAAAVQRLTVFGLPEPEIEQRLVRAALPDGVELAYTVDFPVVRVRLSASGDGADLAVDRAELAARRALEEHLVALGDETLAGATARLLTAAGLTVALAESCTGGLIAKLLTDQPGASAFFERGAVTYANAAKTGWLKVPPPLLARSGAVSAECARAMARGIRRAAGTALGLAVTGIAGPDGGTPDKPVGTVFIALAGADGERVEGFLFRGGRDRIRLHSACTALDWLRRQAIDHLSGER